MQTILSRTPYTGQRPRRKYTEAEKQFMLSNYKTMSMAAMCEELNVGAFKLQMWFKELGIEKPLGKEYSKPQSKFFRHDKNMATI